MSPDQIAIASLIVGALQLGVAVKQTADATAAAPPPGLQEKRRWLQCTLKNQTQFPLLLQEHYHDSGRFYKSLGSVSSFSQMTFSVCTSDTSAGTGVSGGAAFQIDLDSRHSFEFAIGWTNPFLGSFKAGVIEATTAKNGYNAASDNGAFLKSKAAYLGKDDKGKEARIRFHLSATPGQEPVYVITEVREDIGAKDVGEKAHRLPVD